MKVKNIFAITFAIFILQSCGQAYDKSYYEKISGIKIPQRADVIETFDNGEFITVTSFKIAASDMIEFSKRYKFEAVDGSFVPGFLGNNFLKGPKPANSDLNKCLMKIEQKGKATSVYVLDTSKKLLWAEINYPDWAGN
jgi:hypothetical protein